MPAVRGLIGESIRSSVRICKSRRCVAGSLQDHSGKVRMDMQGGQGGPFAYREGRLHVGALPLEEVVAATGTPAYVYDLDAVAAAYRRAGGGVGPPGGGGGCPGQAHPHPARPAPPPPPR